MIESDFFLDYLHKNISKADRISFNYRKHLNEESYYLIYNYIILKGKKIIDKRVVRKIKTEDFIQNFDAEWVPGDEPNMILMPTDKSKRFGFYIQDSFFFIAYEK